VERNVKKSNAIKTSTGKTAYLFGNGINRASDLNRDRYEWGNLLSDLNSQFANNKISNIRVKPFPMVYDEIVSYSVRNGKQNESFIKKFIQSKINNIQTNIRYNNLYKINGAEILTTNYDYLIEKSLGNDWRRSPINKLEYFHSIYRFQKSANSNIWHMHGEQGDSRSILLGFRHYINYSTKVKSRAELFFNGLKKDTTHNNSSWVDLFFTHDIKIIGLSMSFTEYHIWWLLAYRNLKINSDRYVDVNNTITLVIPSFSSDKNSDLIDMLKAYNVKLKIINVTDNDYDTFYDLAIK
jgi:hypothetical protein